MPDHWNNSFFFSSLRDFLEKKSIGRTVVLIAFSAICPPHLANERSTFRQCTAPRATLADTQAVWMHFSGPLACARVWTFLEAQIS